MARTPESSPAPELGELLAQAGWMRALARSLVGDPEEAEEVVQDAWVVALGKRSAVRIDLASWLRTVVRNLALRRIGRESRRPAVERLAARAESSESSTGSSGEVRDAVERMELQRWLAGALLELAEPCRSAVILRHVEGLDAGAIAARQGCSREAARQRVARGLAQLRSELDAKHGGREAWSLLLGPRVAGETPLSVPLTTGGILMGSKAVLASVAAAAALALAWLILERETATPARRGGALPVPEERIALAGDAAEPPRAADVPPAPREVAHDAASVTPAAVATPPSNPLFAVLSGRVVNSTATPIAGAEVLVRRPEAGHFTMLDLETRHAPREAARAVTDGNGRFSFELERGIPFDLAVSASGFCDELLAQRYAGEELEVVLSAGYLVHGFVRRARDLAPIADAVVRVFQMGSSSGVRSTTTAGDGSYRLRITFQQDATLEVMPQREQSSEWITLAFDAEGTARADLLLPDGIEVRGTVVEAESGEPIAGASIGEGWTFRRSVETSALGKYVLPGFGVSGVQELHARAQGHGKAKRANLPAAVDGVLHVDFELPRGRLVRGRVLDVHGRPLADAYVAAVASEEGTEGQSHDWVSGRTDFAGRYELGGLTPALHHCLLASAEGYDTKVYDFPEAELVEPELELGDVRLAPAAMLAGAVQDEEGVALAAMEVILEGTNADRALWRGESALEPAAGWYVDSREATTDARGRFWFGALPAGEFRLRARGRGQPASRRLEVRLAAGELREGVVLVYPRGETIRGTVVDAEGHGLAGVYVNARISAPRTGFQDIQLRVGEDDRARASVKTDQDGAFELRGLWPGTYELDLYPFELASDPDRPWLHTSLAAESAAPDLAEPLRLVLPRGHSIRGRLLDRAGAALVGYVVVGTSAASSESPAGTSGEDGSFLLEVLPGTVWDLEVRGSWQTAAWETVFHTETGVSAGTVELVLRVDVGDEKPR